MFNKILNYLHSLNFWGCFISFVLSFIFVFVFYVMGAADVLMYIVLSPVMSGIVLTFKEILSKDEPHLSRFVDYLIGCVVAMAVIAIGALIVL